MRIFDLQDLGRGSFIEENSDAEINAENDSGRNGALALPLAAIEFVTRLASGIFSRGRKTEDSSSSDSTGENGYKQAELTNPSDERGPFLDDPSLPKFSDTDNCDSEGAQANAENLLSGETSTILENEALERSKNEKSDEPVPSEGDICSFRRFDISQDPLDHHFLGADGQVGQGLALRMTHLLVQNTKTILLPCPVKYGFFTLQFKLET